MYSNQSLSSFGASVSGNCCIVAIGFGWGAANVAGVKLCAYERGRLRLLDETDANMRVGAVCFACEGGILYVAEEHASDVRLQGSGTIRAYRLSNDKLEELGTFPSGDAYPCALAVDSRGSVLAVAHHGLNSSFGLFEESRPGYLVLHQLDDGIPSGDWQVLERQDVATSSQSYYHSVAFLDDDLVLASNTGANTIDMYCICANNAMHPVQNTILDALGSGPRNIKVLKQSRIVIFNYEFDNGFGFLFQKCLGRAHPLDPADNHSCRERRGSSRRDEANMEMVVRRINWSSNDNLTVQSNSSFAIHPYGRWAYAINRAESQIDCFTFDNRAPVLSKFASYGIDGKRARDIIVSPDGRYVFLADTDFDRILRFDIGGDGAISNPACVLETPRPTVIVAAPSTWLSN
ncbi:MAG TPA: beta-propeller fold lactonase family protein [Candidatus Coprousia avicola]|nr:beta-propeller fold lactonase family protein [Candidatus Coprousia avicola]